MIAVELLAAEEPNVPPGDGREQTELEDWTYSTFARGAETHVHINVNVANEFNIST